MYRIANVAVRRACPSGAVLRRTTVPPLPIQAGVRTWRSANGPLRDLDREYEKKLAQEKLPSRPDKVTITSSLPTDATARAPQPEPAEPMGKILKHDMQTLADTVALRSVPPRTQMLGLAGTLPYLGTSLSTIYLGWSLNQEWASGIKGMLLIDHSTAQHLLDFMQPLQVGYGAVILSFLGAIHWGMEFAERKPLPQRTNFRFAMGVMAPAVAWPTLFLPFEWALVSQMAAFTMLYFADTKATTRGWAPPWYGTYRFVLTFVVCLALALSLVGRQWVVTPDSIYAGTRPESRLLTKGLAEPYNSKWQRIEREDREKNKKEAEAARKEQEVAEQAAEKTNKVSAKVSGGKKDDTKAQESSKSDGKDDSKKGKNSSGGKSKDNNAKEPGKEEKGNTKHESSKEKDNNDKESGDETENDSSSVKKSGKEKDGNPKQSEKGKNSSASKSEKDTDDFQEDAQSDGKSKKQSQEKGNDTAKDKDGQSSKQSQKASDKEGKKEGEKKEEGKQKDKKEEKQKDKNEEKNERKKQEQEQGQDEDEKPQKQADDDDDASQQQGDNESSNGDSKQASQKGKKPKDSAQRN